MLLTHISASPIVGYLEHGDTHMAYPLKPETRAKVAAQMQAQRVAMHQDLIAQLQEKYDAEPNREYADAIWGSMLREYGVELSKRED